MTPIRDETQNAKEQYSAENGPNVASSTPPSPPKLPWLEWQKGERVVLRYRLEDGLHDALGYVVDTCAEYVTIDTRRGHVRVEARTMVTGKRVPPPPGPPVMVER